MECSIVILCHCTKWIKIIIVINFDKFTLHADTFLSEEFENFKLFKLSYSSYLINSSVS